MPTADKPASLMDNAEFYAELGKLEATPADDTSEFPEPTPSIGGVPPQLVLRARRPVAQTRVDGPNFMMPPEPRQEAPIVVPMPHVNAAKSSSAMHPALAAIGFVLLMLVGAGAAALVFHDRVALIVAQWQSVSR